MDKVRELMRVLYEENRGVISDEVENALFGIEFGGEAADITHRVGRTRAALYGRETHKHRCDFVRIGKEICFGDLLQALVGLEIAVRRGAASVDDTLRDTLMVEMGDFFAQDEIFQQRRAARSGAQGVLIIGNANAFGSWSAHGLHRPCGEDRAISAFRFPFPGLSCCPGR